jgi:hypothetical protein
LEASIHRRADRRRWLLVGESHLYQYEVSDFQKLVKIDQDAPAILPRTSVDMIFQFTRRKGADWPHRCDPYQFKDKKLKPREGFRSLTYNVGKIPGLLQIGSGRALV